MSIKAQLEDAITAYIAGDLHRAASLAHSASILLTELALGGNGSVTIGPNTCIGDDKEWVRRMMEGVDK